MPNRLLALALPIFLLSCGSDSDAPGGTDGPNGGLGGVWDITSYNTGGPAEMTVVGTAATGFIATRSEGKSGFLGVADCVATKDRVEFTFNASGDTANFTRTDIVEATGAGCPSYANRKRTVTFSGVRTQPAAPSATALNGEWLVTGEQDSWTATMNGLGVSATSNTSAKRPDPDDQDTVTIAVAGGTMTISSTEKNLSFAARKR